MRVLIFVCSLTVMVAGEEQGLPACPKGELRCPGTSKCVKLQYFCDQKRDCEDGADEADCLGENPSSSPPCDEKDCAPPNCFCSRYGMKIPGGLTREETPQMVMVTFDDAVQGEIEDEIVDILDDGITNPNGCSIKGTFFVSHAHTDYSLVNRAHRQGHEIASHSITHNDNDGYWRRLDPEGWRKEMIGQRYLVSEMANITRDDIKGMRVPLLAHGGNNMFEMMMRSDGFVYDSSIGAPYEGPPGQPIWPYTMDYKMPHECRGEPAVCPSRAFPGIWEIPLNTIDNLAKAYYRRNPYTGVKKLVFPQHIAGNQGCGMADSCHTANTDPRLFYDMLVQAFYRHYYGNRAPLGIFLHASTFKGHPRLLKPLRKFLQGIAVHDDVYFVRMNDVIEWMKSPTPLGETLNNFAPWKERCRSHNYIKERRRLNDRCVVKPCRYALPDRTMYICADECPDAYPDLRWLEDHV